MLSLLGLFLKLLIQGIRMLPLPATFDNGDAGSYVASVIKLLAWNVKNRLSQEHVVKAVRAALTDIPTYGLRQHSAGAAMYLGCVLIQVHMCLFDDKRDRRMVHFYLVVTLVAFNSSLGAIHFEVWSVSFRPAGR
jgi:hypothetical protein